MNEILALAKDDRHARLLLAAATAPGDKVTGRLVAEIGAVETVRLAFDEPTPQGFGPVLIDQWRRETAPYLKPSAFRRGIEAVTNGFIAVFPGEPAWPAQLDDLGYAQPLMLWARGDLALLNVPTDQRVAVAGSRAATSYGVEVAKDLAAGLVRREIQVVSGGAYGIGAAAHRGTLAADGQTVAVLPAGLDRLYPVGNRDLFDRILQNGLLVSERPPGSTPSRATFFGRNRVVAALTGATVVVEAAMRSGALHSAEWARRLGRPLGAVPGPVTSAASYGTHHLLQKRVANLITDPSDVVDLVRPPELVGGGPARDLALAPFAPTVEAPSVEPPRPGT